MKSKLRSYFSAEPKEELKDRDLELCSPEEGKAVQAEADSTRDKGVENFQGNNHRNTSVQIARGFHPPWDGHTVNGQPIPGQVSQPGGALIGQGITQLPPGTLRTGSSDMICTTGQQEKLHTTRMHSLLKLISRKPSKDTKQSSSSPSTPNSKQQASPFSGAAQLSGFKPMGDISPDPLKLYEKPSGTQQAATGGAAAAGANLMPPGIGNDQESALKLQLQMLKGELQALQSKASERVQTKPAATTATSPIPASRSATSPTTSPTTSRAATTTVPVVPIILPTTPAPAPSPATSSSTPATPLSPAATLQSVGPSSHVIDWADDESRASEMHAHTVARPKPAAGSIPIQGIATGGVATSIHVSTNEIQALDVTSAYSNLGRLQKGSCGLDALLGTSSSSRLDVSPNSPLASANGVLPQTTISPSRLSLVSGFSTSKSALKQTSTGGAGPPQPVQWQVAHAATNIVDDDSGQAPPARTRTDVDDELKRTGSHRSLTDFMKNMMKNVGMKNRGALTDEVTSSSASFQKDSPRGSGTKMKLFNGSTNGLADSSPPETKEHSRWSFGGGGILLQTTASLRRDLDNVANASPKRPAAARSRRTSIDGLTRAMTKSFTAALSRRGSMDISHTNTDVDDGELDDVGIVPPAPEPDLQSGMVQLPTPPQRCSLDGANPSLISTLQTTMRNITMPSPDKDRSIESLAGFAQKSVLIENTIPVYGTSQTKLTTATGRVLQSTAYHHVDGPPPSNPDITPILERLNSKARRKSFERDNRENKGRENRENKGRENKGRENKGRENKGKEIKPARPLNSQPISGLRDFLLDSSDTDPTSPFNPGMGMADKDAQGVSKIDAGVARTLNLSTTAMVQPPAQSTSLISSAIQHTLVMSPPTAPKFAKRRSIRFQDDDIGAIYSVQDPSFIPETEAILPSPSIANPGQRVTGTPTLQQQPQPSQPNPPPKVQIVGAPANQSLAQQSSIPSQQQHLPAASSSAVDKQQRVALPAAHSIRPNATQSEPKQAASSSAQGNSPVPKAPVFKVPASKAAHGSTPSTPVAALLPRPVPAHGSTSVRSHGLEGIHEFDLDSTDLTRPITARSSSTTAGATGSTLGSPQGSGGSNDERVQSTVDLLLSKLMSLPAEIRLQIAQDLTRRGSGQDLVTAGSTTSLAPLTPKALLSTVNTTTQATASTSQATTLNTSAIQPASPQAVAPQLFPSAEFAPATMTPQPAATMAATVLPTLPAVARPAPVVVTAVPIPSPFGPPSPPLDMTPSAAAASAGVPAIPVTAQHIAGSTSGNTQSPEPNRPSPQGSAQSRPETPLRLATSAPYPRHPKPEAPITWSSPGTVLDHPYLMSIPPIMHPASQPAYVPLETSRGSTMAAVLAAAIRLEAEEFDSPPVAIPAHIQNAFSSNPSTPVEASHASNPYFNSFRQQSIISSPMQSQWCLAPILPPHPLMFALAPSGLLIPGMPVSEPPRSATPTTRAVLSESSPPRRPPSTLGPNRLHQSMKSPLSGASIEPGSNTSISADEQPNRAPSAPQVTSLPDFSPRALSPMHSYVQYPGPGSAVLLSPNGTWSPAPMPVDTRMYSRGPSPLQMVSIPSQAPPVAMPQLQQPSRALFQDFPPLPMMQQPMQWVVPSPMHAGMQAVWMPDSLPPIAVSAQRPSLSERMTLASHPVRQ